MSDSKDFLLMFGYETFPFTLELSFKPKNTPQTKETHKLKKATHNRARYLPLGLPGALGVGKGNPNPTPFLPSL